MKSGYLTREQMIRAYNWERRRDALIDWMLVPMLSNAAVVSLGLRLDAPIQITAIAAIGGAVAALLYVLNLIKEW